MRRRGSVQSLRSHARQLCPGPVTVCLDAPRSSDVGLVTRRHRHSLFFGTAESEKTRESSKEHPITSGGIRIEGWGSLSRPPQWKPVDASSPPKPPDASSIGHSVRATTAIMSSLYRLVCRCVPCSPAHAYSPHWRKTLARFAITTCTNMRIQSVSRGVRVPDNHPQNTEHCRNDWAL